jgi:hypothetical protein
MNFEELNVRESLDSFFTNKEDGTRVSMINFLYGGRNKLEEEKIAVSDRLIGRKEEYSFINEYSLEIVEPIKKTDRILNLFVDNWGKLTDRIHCYYKNYIMNLTSNPIKYLIVSEAPLLDISKPTKFKCNYIFGENQECTIYRSTPYHAFKKLVDVNYSDTSTTKVTQKNIFNCMNENSIAFIDLVPIPLPSIPTEVRRDWSFNEYFRIDEGYPLSFSLFIMAFERFKKKYVECHDKEPSFDKKLKIIFMMPPKTSMGIIDYLATDPIKRKNDLPKELQKHINIIIRTNDINAKNVSPALAELPLRQYRQVAVNYSNNPCIETFLHAIRD